MAVRKAEVKWKERINAIILGNIARSYRSTLVIFSLGGVFIVLYKEFKEEPTNDSDCSSSIIHAYWILPRVRCSTVVMNKLQYIFLLNVLCVEMC